ncbi:quinolinate synthase [Candidatus Woesearchaeota archaeon]|nr:MAG: quinolinate synthase [Candidatus Woesearchaeota archaeon]
MSEMKEIPSIEEIKQHLESYPSVTKADAELHAERIREILEIKKKHNVVILGHNYMEPLVFECSEEQERGDSYGLSEYAARTDADIIVFNGVRFMAETAKVLNPEKKVLIADRTAGCSLADNFTAENVKELKQKHPGVPVMIYINSYADAKAESDVVCTSANAAKIAKKLPGNKVIFVPDILFAQNLAEELRGVKEIIYPEEGRGAICEVHEKFSIEDINAVRKSFEIPKGHPKRMIYAHWECRPEVLREADFYGSTTQIRKDIAERVSKGMLEKAFVASECELTSNLAAEFPQVQFYTACSVRCSHMAKITIEKLHRLMKAIDSGEDLSEWEVALPEEVIEKARKPIEKMLELGR